MLSKRRLGIVLAVIICLVISTAGFAPEDGEFQFGGDVTGKADGPASVVVGNEYGDYVSGDDYTDWEDILGEFGGEIGGTDLMGVIGEYGEPDEFGAYVIDGGAYTVNEAETAVIGEILAQCNRAMAGVTSYECDMLVDVSFDAMGENYGLTMDAGMDMILDPLKMRMGAEASMYGEEITMEMYIEDGVMYVGVGPDWVQMSFDEIMPGIDINSLAARDTNMGVNSMYVDHLTLAGIEQVDGRNAYAIEARITGAEIKEVLNSAMLLMGGFLGGGLPGGDMYGSYDSSYAEALDMLDSIIPDDGEISVMHYIYADDYLFAGMKIDMAGFLEGLFANTIKTAMLESPIEVFGEYIEGAGESGFSTEGFMPPVNVNSAVVEMVFSRYDNVRNFSVPSAVTMSAESVY